MLRNLNYIPLEPLQMEGKLPHTSHVSRWAQHRQHCLKPFDILTGLVDKPIISIKGSRHRLSLCLRWLSWLRLSLQYQGNTVKLIYGISGSQGAKIFHLCFKGVLPPVTHEGNPAPTHLPHRPQLLWDSPPSLQLHLSVVFSTT